MIVYKLFLLVKAIKLDSITYHKFISINDKGNLKNRISLDQSFSTHNNSYSYQSI